MIIEIQIDIGPKLKGISTLPMETCAHQNQIGSLNRVKETHCLTRVNYHQNLFVFTLDIHFLIYFCKVF